MPKTEKKDFLRMEASALCLKWYKVFYIQRVPLFQFNRHVIL